MTLRRQDWIEEREGVMMGKPVFRGTRLAVEHILGEMEAGMGDAELLDNYPTLRPEPLRAARLHAFTGEVRSRLVELMGRWRPARGSGGQLPPEDQAELQGLAEAEIEAAGRRAAGILGSSSSRGKP
jgi:uncharacterized protein (DUF433 family)